MFEVVAKELRYDHRQSLLHIIHKNSHNFRDRKEIFQKKKGKIIHKVSNEQG